MLLRVYAGGSLLGGLCFKKFLFTSVEQIHPWQVELIQSLADQIPLRLRRDGISSAKDWIRSTCPGCISCKHNMFTYINVSHKYTAMHCIISQFCTNIKARTPYKCFFCGKFHIDCPLTENSSGVYWILISKALTFGPSWGCIIR